MKLCTRCNLEKSLDHFPKCKASKDGLHCYCRACNKERVDKWRLENPEKIKAAAKRRAADGRAKLHTKKYRERNPEKVAAQRTRYYAEHAEEAKAYSRQYAAGEDPAVRRARKAAWKKANPESVKATKHRNRAKRQQAEGSHTAQDLRDLFQKQRGKCAVCRTDLPAAYHVDHIQPIARGGSNGILNIQLLCRICNQTKSAKDPVDFMQEKGFLL